MASNDATLVLIPYLQAWDKASSKLSLSLLIIPRVDPLKGLKTGLPAFADCKFVVDVHLQGVGALPTLPGGTALLTISLPAVTTSRPIFSSLAALYPIDPSPKRATRDPNNAVRKYAPPSYQAASGSTRTRTDLVSTDKDSYYCALKLGSTSWTYKPLPKPNPLVSWGKVMAILLRNPALARAAGLIRDIDIPIADPTVVMDGGFVYLTLATTSDGAPLIADPAGLQLHAARFPRLRDSRPLFTALAFPVATSPPPVDYGPLFAEVQDYDDGWAKTVHCWQAQFLDRSADPANASRPVRDQGIQIGWDDEQVTLWMDRQLGNTGGFDSPVGVQGYRIDVRLATDTVWTSLTAVSGPLGVPGVELGQFNGELSVETHPAQLDAKLNGEFWLPEYFSQWVGSSLIGLDPDRLKISGVANPNTPNPIKGVPPKIALVYGKEYQFRVRLVDHTGGGPRLSDSPTNPGPNPVADWSFRRWIRPLRLKIVNKIPEVPDPINAPTVIKVKRPLMRAPAVIFTGQYNNPVDLLLADLPAAQAENREAGLPDPDVDRLQIIVEVQGLAQDKPLSAGGFRALYTTTRPFPSDVSSQLSITLNWIDIKDVSQIVRPDTGPIVLPTARLVNLRLAALGKDDKDLKYFGADDVRLGLEKSIQLQKYSSSELKFFLAPEIGKSLVAYYLQPDLPIHASTLLAQNANGNKTEAPLDISTRFASALGLRNDGLAIRAQPGQRVVFACSSSLHYVIGPDRASFTFASQSDLSLRWIVVVRLTIDRDWSWNGLAENGISISRNGVAVDSFSPGRNVSPDALLNPQRGQTDIVFLDAIDPKPPGGSFPQILHPKYSIKAAFLGGSAADGPLELSIDLPVTTAPLQVPKIASAGIALSPYNRASDYSSTAAPRKALWIEFAESAEDSRDALFARVLLNAPDPLLTVSTTSPSLSGAPQDRPLEPALPIPPEWVRTIVPGSADDQAGLTAMQRLIPSSDSHMHFALPLPPGLSDSSPELFGFFTYEFRFGHSDVWSTAQGRFGPPLRVTGIQHPPPSLTCSALRTRKSISVSVPFAYAVRDKAVAASWFPRTRIWALLYAQAAQADGQDRRNVLVAAQEALLRDRGRNVHVPPVFANAAFELGTVMGQLGALGFLPNAPLSVLAVELLPQPGQGTEPLGGDLGSQRILRTSNLVPVPQMCG